MKYLVSSGWVSYRKVGSHIEERYSDNPLSDVFDSYDEAVAMYDSIDIVEQWRTERACAGRAFDGRDAYKSIERYGMFEDEYGDEDIDDIVVIAMTKYGWNEEEE